MPLNLNKARKCLANFDFQSLFIDELGWSHPVSNQALPMKIKDAVFTRQQIAQLAGVVVLEIVSKDGQIPDAKTRLALHREISALYHENLLIFVGERRTQSLWYWTKRQDGRISARNHIYVRGQPGDLFLSKLNAMVFDLSDFDDSGNVPLLQVTESLKEALDVERVTKDFFVKFDAERLEFTELIKGIDVRRDQEWYASVLLNRLMFVYFLQRKFFLDSGDERYLQNKLEQSRKKDRDLYYEKFLKVLFFEGFAKPEAKRADQTNELLGKIKYLNGGLFLKHRIEIDWPEISIPDKAFENLFALFGRYSWNLNDTPGGEDNEINPDVLGYIFEKYINQKAFGAYYTRPEITEYLCERTIHRLILDTVNKADAASNRVKKSGREAVSTFQSMGDLLLALNPPLCKKLLREILPNLRLLDPACGSAAFLVSAMKTLINVYAAVIGKIEFLNDRGLHDWLKKIQKEHKSVSYFIKRSIITNNLFGVDIMEEAIEIAKLRLFLALVASANSADDLEPLPNIEFNIMAGNSLIGLLRVDEKDFDKFAHDLASKAFFKDYRQVLEEKNHLVGLYRRATAYAEDLQSLRDGIEEKKQKAIGTLNRLLLDQFQGIKYEEATWDEKKNCEGKAKKRSLNEEDIKALKPFHWGYEFDEIINRKTGLSSAVCQSEGGSALRSLDEGGFDAIITNPPWEIFKPNAKEFFEEFSALVSKKKMTIKDFEKEQAKLLKDVDIREAWMKYQGEYPHVSAFFRSAPQFKNQISIINGKKAGTDINLYKLFVEQCFNLLRKGGYCGIVIPSGIYTDLGTKQLREMLFGQTRITGLFCFENRKEIFEGVHRSYKFLVLSFEKGNVTKTFPAAFMRHDVGELERFPQEDAINISVELIRRLSPDSLSIREFKNERDVQIAKKISQFPRLGEKLSNRWNLVLGNEFHMTNDSHLFKTEPGKGRLSLYEGKMIWQFDNHLSKARYWIEEKEGRKAILVREPDKGQKLGYQGYRLGHRSIASSTNERTMIAAILPQRFFFGHSINASRAVMTGADMLLVVSLLNSYVFDYTLRSSISSNLTMFFVYQLPVPRLTENDAAFWPIVKRASRLICTTPEFDNLAKEVGLKNHKDGAASPAERAKLRAELDGLIAHLYGLTEDEFAYILTTFPLVKDEIKQAASQAYRDAQEGLIK
ncbi:MAG: Eco57I restriction-modification methylase domain-containing protein [Kiritimatiellae bacterium]|nr:Eco57I restriction-modification methylase domain-containing protein [Kiritimatiellia bacterium]